ncbi:SpoIIE family protein phosphatase [Roseofilum sp. BLCC_M154]|uniref:SpoIIE family protein phosphatase n=1 Tax=Roseofilum acuticapitatum BLCC-M154 TaxID=3022444 RepID=A0ABT7AYF8_9CYAN|nr:SpoIIE family protein phosphatase [Roseofilum acuticapitatum]MDJ1171484.1 SpoIIE family protein phosphatase [Roseofilum acuticapitatum BLCC-M154]
MLVSISRWYKGIQNWSLSAKLTATYSLLITLVAGSLTLSLYLQFQRTQRQAIKERLRDIIALSVPQIDSDFHALIVTPSDRISSYYQITQQRLKEIQAMSNSIKHIYTLRESQEGSIRVIVDYAPPPASIRTVGTPLTPITPLLEKGLEHIQEPKVESRFFTNAKGELVVYGYAPIVNSIGRLDGILAIELDASPVRESEKRARAIASITFLTSLPLALLLGWLLARHLTAPIAELVEAVERIAQGDRDTLVQVRTQDEVGILAQTFNRMSRQLKTSFETLEAKVAQRTTQLAQANQAITALNQRLKQENLRMGAELEITRKLQQMILPKSEELSQILGLEIAGYMEPAAEVGGDYYDVLEQDGRIKIAIGDVTGHGLESGVVMIMVQSAARALLANNETNPVKFLDALNRTIYNNLERMKIDKHLTFMILDYYEGILKLSGQHEEIIIVRSGGIIERIDTIDLGFPIGLDREISPFIAEENILLNSGDIVFLYTDGVTEAENSDGVHYGVNRLCEILRQNWQKSAEEIRQSVIEDILRHIDQQKIYDDITLLVLKKR